MGLIGHGRASICALVLLGCAGPPAPSGSPSTTCAAPAETLAEGARLAADGYLGRALRVSETAVAACPSTEALSALGAVLADLGLRERGIAAYERAGDAAGVARARALPPEQRAATPEQQAEARLYYRRGFDLRLAGEHDRAITMFRSSYKHWPHPLTIVQIGLAHRAAGRDVEYRKANARALALAERMAGESARAVLRRGHVAGVTSLAFHPSRPLLVTGGDDGRAILWDLRSGRMVTSFEGHGGRVKAVALSPDGRLLATASADETARLWEVDTGRVRHVFDTHTSPVEAIVFSPDGRVVASASTTQPMLWSAETGELIGIPSGRGQRTIAFSPDGARLLAGRGSNLHLWNVATLEDVRDAPAHEGGVRAAAFSPDGRTIASGGADRMVRLWDAASGAELAALRGHEGEVVALAFAPGGTTLVTAGRDGAAIVWDVTARAERARLPHAAPLLGVAISPDGARIATGSLDGAVTEWDAVTGERVRDLRGGGAAILALDVSANGQRLATGSIDGTVKLWDLERPRAMQVLPVATDWVWDVALSADGARLACVSGPGPSRAAVWDVAGRTALHAVEVAKASRSIALAPDGRTVVVANEATELWDPDRGAIRASFDNGPYLARGRLAMNRSGTALAVTGAAQVRWWSLTVGGPDGDPRDAREPGGNLMWSLAVSDDGALVAAGSDDGSVHVWDARSGKVRASHPDHPAQVWSLAFAPDGRLASGGDGQIVVRDPARDAAPLTVRAHGDRVESIRFLAGGDLMVSASRDQTVKIHDARTGEARATIYGTADDGWVIVDAADRVDGDAGAIELIDWHAGDVVLPGYIGWQRNHHPGLLRAVSASSN